jgi:carbon storage regulator CsrA
MVEGPLSGQRLRVFLPTSMAGEAISMLVLTRRLNEKILLPELHTAIQVVALTQHHVRLGIDAPDEVRILREEVPDQLAGWHGNEGEPSLDPLSPLSLIQLSQLLQKRLEVARLGLVSAREQMASGELEDASNTLDRLEEDLHLLRTRMQKEVGAALRPEPPVGRVPTDRTETATNRSL